LRRRALLASDRPVLRHRVAAVLSASTAVTAQVEAVAGPGGAPIVEFLPLYRRALYAGVAAADARASVLRVLFVGRVESDKGVFDLFEAALRLRDRADLAFDVCGDGSALPELERRVGAAGIGERFVLHGWCDRPKLVEILSRAHVGCVPTPSSFKEGFNQAALEMILAGRPVVTSAAIPALDYVGRAVREVPPDDPAGLARAFVELAEDRDAWERLRQACPGEGEKFFNHETSYGAALGSVLADLSEGRPIRPRRIGLDGRLAA
jgi:glycosyltransferase involved in cell wall biosynthesis